MLCSQRPGMHSDTSIPIITPNTCVVRSALAPDTQDTCVLRVFQVHHNTCLWLQLGVASSDANQVCNRFVVLVKHLLNPLLDDTSQSPQPPLMTHKAGGGCKKQSRTHPQGRGDRGHTAHHAAVAREIQACTQTQITRHDQQPLGRQDGCCCVLGAVLLLLLLRW